MNASEYMQLANEFLKAPLAIMQMYFIYKILQMYTEHTKEVIKLLKGKKE